MSCARRELTRQRNASALLAVIRLWSLLADVGEPLSGSRVTFSAPASIFKSFVDHMATEKRVLLVVGALHPLLPATCLLLCRHFCWHFFVFLARNHNLSCTGYASLNFKNLAIL